MLDAGNRPFRTLVGSPATSRRGRLAKGRNAIFDAPVRCGFGQWRVWLRPEYSVRPKCGDCRARPRSEAGRPADAWLEHALRFRPPPIVRDRAVLCAVAASRLRAANCFPGKHARLRFFRPSQSNVIEASRFAWQEVRSQKSGVAGVQELQNGEKSKFFKYS